MARDYKANGFFFTNLNGYSMNHLIARQTGVYGVYAFNTIGGEILNSEAYYVNDGAFYIGQTPPQSNPVQTIVRNVEGWGSPLGFSATNMRYVTITKSRFYNNAAGIVPNAFDSEKYPPAENNVIIDNDIFWNNFNFHQGKPPFPVRDEGTAALVPVGTGILLLGGRGNRIENNRIHGNFLAGVAAVESILVTENPEARALQRNIVRNNQFGLSGTDANGSDVMYDGNGNDNCFSMEGVTSTFPADGSTFAGCIGPNAFSASGAAADDRLHRRERGPGRGRSIRIRPRPGTPRSRCSAGEEAPDRRAGRRRAPERGAGAGRDQEDVKVGDNYYAPTTVAVKRGTTVTWRWPGFEEAGDVHDVKLKSGPKGVKKFASEAACDGLLVQAQADRRRDLQDRLHAAPRDAHDDQGLRSRLAQQALRPQQHQQHQQQRRRCRTRSATG